MNIINSDLMDQPDKNGRKSWMRHTKTIYACIYVAAHEATCIYTQTHTHIHTTRQKEPFMEPWEHGWHVPG